MGELVNLNRARKAKAKAADRDAAAQNRAAHGRSKAEKALESLRKQKAARLLDQVKREP